MNKPKVVETIAELRNAIAAARNSGKKIGFVPTMGFLHDGHLSLVELCQKQSEFVVVSIFVNPTQFGANEDLDSYPRDLERDRELLASKNTDLIFSPHPDEIYPDQNFIQFSIDSMADQLCGASRPGHFEGVLQVVAKLFNMVQPDVAAFGQKDLQQLVLIKRMAQELNFPIKILAGPTIREADGLAMSSRNSYLADAERETSVALYQALKLAQEKITAGERESQKIIGAMQEYIESNVARSIDYVEIVKIRDLQPIENVTGLIGIALAVHVGKARLIDNLVLEVEGEHVREIAALD